MTRGTLVAAGLLIAIAACSASGTVREDTDAGGATADGGPLDAVPDASLPEDAAPDVDLDAARPLLCGDAGLCETRLPTSDLGVPLSLRAVWSVGPNDVWSASAEGHVLHYDGTSWRTEFRANHALYAIWATSNNVWAGGEGGLLLRRDPGGQWSFVDSGHVTTVRSIYGTSDDDVWFTSHLDSIDHFDGTSLKNHPLGVPGLVLVTVFGRPGFGPYGAGYVPGPVAGSTYPHASYVFTLSTTGILPFNPSNQGVAGFLPVSAIVTDSPDENQRVFLAGYRSLSVFGSEVHFVRYWSFGPASPSGTAPKGIPGYTSGLTAPQIAYTLSYGPNDVRMTWERGRMLRWDGSAFVPESFAMGYDFAPGVVCGTDSHSADLWIVGDGFALHGAKP